MARYMNTEKTHVEHDGVFYPIDSPRLAHFLEAGLVVEPYVKPEDEVVLEGIVALEVQVTERRKREAILTDGGKQWLLNQEILIAAERAKLRGGE